VKTKYIIFLFISYFILTASECKKSETIKDNPLEIENYSPSTLVLEQAIGDTIDFSIEAIDADGDAISYRTLVNDEPVNNSNSYRFIVPDLGTYTIQMDAFNDEIDIQTWTVNVENEAPVISSISNVTKQEDTIEVGSVAKSLTVNDDNDSLDDLVIELSQTNENLIKFGLDNDNNIIVEDYTADGNGSSTVTVKVTDSHGAVSEKSFVYNITPMTDIEGKILDSDTWEPNNALQGFAIIQGDTVWADATGKYKTQINPTSNIDIEAGYRSLDKLNPMSFITTAKNVLVGNDVSNADIMVVIYLNNNLTPEEMRILAWETNFGQGNYTGAKVPSTSMVDKLITSGNPATSWDGSTYLEEMTPEEIADIKRIRADSINVYLKHPSPLEEVVYYDGIKDETNIVSWEKQRWDNTRVTRTDFDNDGIIDNTNIITSGTYEGFYDSFISGLLEEGFASRGQYYGVFDTRLAGKTIAYEQPGIEQIHKGDIKFIKLIEGIAHEKGYLIPKMSIDDVLKVQN